MTGVQTPQQFAPSAALARLSDPSTSKEAADSFDPTDLEQTVLGAVMVFPDGAIQDDVLALLEPQGYKYGTITPRFRSLLNKGLLVDTGAKRKAKSGRSQRVLKVKQFSQANSQQ